MDIGQIGLNLLIQVPLVGAFIYFTLQLNKQNIDANTKRAEQDAKALSEREKEWRDFLSNQAKTFAAALEKLAISQRASARERTRQQAATHNLLVAHDNWERAGVSKLLHNKSARRR